MSIHNSDWLTRNSTRTYPFLEGSGLTERFLVSGEIKKILDNQIIDMRLSGCESFFHDVGLDLFYNIDYFLYKIERVGSSHYLFHVREIQREVYNEAIPSTFLDVGSFQIDYTHPFNSQFPFTPFDSNIPIQGNITMGESISGYWPVGVHEFLPAQTTFESRVTVPNPGEDFITSIGVEGDSFLAKGDVTFREGYQVQITSEEGQNGLRFDFIEEELDCEAEDSCIEDRICSPLSLMTLKGVEGDHRFNVHLQGENGIQVSALVGLIPGSDPFNPSNYRTTGVVITYAGPVTFEYTGGDVSDPSNWNYGLECSRTDKAKELGGLQNLVSSVQSQLEQLGDAIDALP